MYSDILNARRRLGDGLTVFSQTFKMELNRFLDKFQHFLSRFTCGNTARQVRHISSKTIFTFFNNHGVTHVFHTSRSLQACLL